MIIRPFILDGIKVQHEPMIQFAYFQADNRLPVGRKSPVANTFFDQGFRLPAFHGNSLDRLIVSPVHVKNPLPLARALGFALVGAEGKLL